MTWEPSEKLLLEFLHYTVAVPKTSSLFHRRRNRQSYCSTFSSEGNLSEEENTSEHSARQTPDPQLLSSLSTENLQLALANCQSDGLSDKENIVQRMKTHVKSSSERLPPVSNQKIWRTGGEHCRLGAHCCAQMMMLLCLCSRWMWANRVTLMTATLLSPTACQGSTVLSTWSSRCCVTRGYVSSGRAAVPPHQLYPVACQDPGRQILENARASCIRTGHWSHWLSHGNIPRLVCQHLVTMATSEHN